MKNFKNFYLSYIKGELCKKTLEEAKNYFYDFFKKDIIENAELARLTELQKLVTPHEASLIERRLTNLKIKTREHVLIASEVEGKIASLKEKNYHEAILQGVYLKNILKLYPNQAEYILKDYGIFVYEFAKELNIADLDGKEEIVLNNMNSLFTFVYEYKIPIKLAIDWLKNTECNLIHGLKINHALQMGYEAFLIGGIKKDGVTAAILADALQYSNHAEKLQAKVKSINEDFNGPKVLDIYYKTGQDPSLLEKPWSERKRYQLNSIKTPGATSFSASAVLMIGKKISLYEISKLFEEYETLYKHDNPKATSKDVEEYIAKKKDIFWKEYDSITEEEAKKYYSDLAYSLSRIGTLPEFLFEEYEKEYFAVFKEYPGF